MDDFFIGVFIVGFVLSTVGGCAYNFKGREEAEVQLTKLQEKYTNETVVLKDKYNGLSCKMRGYVVEEVEGIKLCMEPVTRSLHKIDDVTK